MKITKTQETVIFVALFLWAWGLTAFCALALMKSAWPPTSHPTWQNRIALACLLGYFVFGWLAWNGLIHLYKRYIQTRILLPDATENPMEKL